MKLLSFKAFYLKPKTFYLGIQTAQPITLINFSWHTYHGCVKSTVIERRQHQLGRMADFLPPVTFSVFDL